MKQASQCTTRRDENRKLTCQKASRPKALVAIRTARAKARQRVPHLAKDAAPDTAQVIVDIDGVLALAHSNNQGAAATWKKTMDSLAWKASEGQRASVLNADFSVSGCALAAWSMSL